VTRNRTGQTVCQRIRQLRESQGLTLADLSSRLKKLGRSYSVSTMWEIEKGSRRVDVDDLVALSFALKVTPLTLLMPDTKTSDESITTTASPDPVPAERYWWWLRTEQPLIDGTQMDNLEFQWRSKPTWHTAEVRGGSQTRADTIAQATQQPRPSRSGLEPSYREEPK
jgi:transcriptional regulator with XRE-family HTH domain